jgi:hypothetical protein
MLPATNYALAGPNRVEEQPLSFGGRTVYEIIVTLLRRSGDLLRRLGIRTRNYAEALDRHLREVI